MDSIHAQPPLNDQASYARSDVLWQSVAPTDRPHDSLVARVYEALWKQIVEGERVQGERLIDGEVAQALGVSRTPVRQALYRLQQAGLVVGHGRGFWVATYGPEELRELYDLRMILECAAVHAAVGRIPSGRLRAALVEITALRKLNEPEAPAALPGRLEPGARFLRSDVELHHSIIAGHTGNRRLAGAIAEQRARLSVFVVGGTRLPSGIPRALDEHEIIVRALLDGDAEGAAAAMERHIRRVRDAALSELTG